MRDAKQLTPEQIKQAAYEEELRQCCARLEARQFSEMKLFLAGERLRDTPIAIQMQAVSATCASMIAAAVAPIAEHQREAAALTMLKGLGDMVCLALIEQQFAAASNQGGEHAH